MAASQGNNIQQLVNSLDVLERNLTAKVNSNATYKQTVIQSLQQILEGIRRVKVRYDAANVELQTLRGLPPQVDQSQLERLRDQHQVQTQQLNDSLQLANQNAQAAQGQVNQLSQDISQLRTASGQELQQLQQRLAQEAQTATAQMTQLRQQLDQLQPQLAASNGTIDQMNVLAGQALGKMENLMRLVDSIIQDPEVQQLNQSTQNILQALNSMDQDVVPPGSRPPTGGEVRPGGPGSGIFAGVPLNASQRRTFGVSGGKKMPKYGRRRTRRKKMRGGYQYSTSKKHRRTNRSSASSSINYEPVVNY
jgi:chromosome segregation ATPase